MNNWSISIHIFFLWFQIYICSEFENEHFTGRRSSNHGNLIKTKSGKTFLQRSSKGKKYNTEIQKYNRQIKYHAQETDSGFDEYSQVNIIGWVKREKEGALTELRNGNSFTRSKILELNVTPRKARKQRQFWQVSQIKCAKKDSFGEQMLTILSNQAGLYTKIMHNCANLPKKG